MLSKMWIQSVGSIDLENILNSTKDSAFDGDSSYERILATQCQIWKIVLIKVKEKLNRTSINLRWKIYQVMKGML